MGSIGLSSEVRLGLGRLLGLRHTRRRLRSSVKDPLRELAELAEQVGLRGWRPNGGCQLLGAKRGAGAMVSTLFDIISLGGGGGRDLLRWCRNRGRFTC